MGPSEGAAREAVRLAVSAAALAGVLVSRRLWLSSHRLFPLTPVWRALPQPPYPLDYILFGLTLASLAGVAVFRRRPAPFIKAFLALAGVLAVLDQSRWQPWMMMYAVILGALLLPPSRALHPCRLFLACAYFYSGLHKLGYGFVLVTAAMLEPVSRRLHISSSGVVAMAVAMAVFECGAGVLLLVPRTRRAAAAGLAAMHLALLLWLGPFGLDWNRAIWPWNAAMAVVVMTLFWSKSDWNLAALWHSHAYAKAIAVAFGVLPLLAFVGLWDSYPAFALYSGDVKEGMVYAGPKAIADLPAGVRPYAKADGIIDIDRWSASELAVPVYPETRLFASVGRQVASWLPSGTPVRVIELEKPDRFAGERKATSFDPLTY